MPYLDKEEKFYDYRTDSVEDKILFDTKTTGTSFYNNFLNDLDYMQKSKNMTGEIVMMTPKEYFEGCAKIFNSTPERQISQTRAAKETLEHLRDVLHVYKKKFPIGFLNYAEETQEGRHRMLVAAEEVGWDVEQPVLVIDWLDKEKHKQEVEQKKRYDIERRLERAVENALRYTFVNIEDLRTQLQWEINRQFDKYYGDLDKEFELTSDANQFRILCDGVEYTFPYEDVKFKQEDEEFEFDLLDDVDSTDIDEFIKQYL